jgi:hypothetical protein
MSSGNMTHPRSQISLQNHDLMISWPPVFSEVREVVGKTAAFSSTMVKTRDLK